MLELQQNCEYLFYDLDPDSVSDLAEWRDTLEIVRCTVARTNGLSAVAAWVGHEASDTIVHIDPFDPELVGGDGRSALDLAEHLIERGTGLVYWYGYDNPSQAAWAYKRLARGGASVWCADAMITDSNGSDSGGDWVCGPGALIAPADLASLLFVAHDCGLLRRSSCLEYPHPATSATWTQELVQRTPCRSQCYIARSGTPGWGTVRCQPGRPRSRRGDLPARRSRGTALPH